MIFFKSGYLQKSLSLQKWLLIYLIPFLLLIWFVLNHGANVFFMDEWHLIPMFQNFASGTLSFDDLFRQNNEHRLFFPKIIYLIVAFTSNLNIWIELFINVILAFLTVFTIHSIASKIHGSITPLLTVSLLLCALIFCSLIQYDNWLMGFQLAFFMIQAGVVLAVRVLISDRWTETRRLWIAAGICFVVSFCSAHGLISWLAMAPLVLSLSGDRKTSIKYSCIWGALFLITVAIYFYGYQEPKADFIPDKTFFLKQPLQAAAFFFVLVGAQFGYSFQFDPVSTALVFGLVIFVSFIVLTIHSLKTGLFNIQKPWIAVGLFGLICATSMTIGRSGYGPSLGLTSRYITAPTYLLIAVVQMYAAVCSWQIPALSSRRFWFTFTAGLLTALVLSSNGYVVAKGHEIKTLKDTQNLCTEFIRYIDPVTDTTDQSCLFKIYQTGPEKYAEMLRSAAEVINDLGFRNLASRIEFVEFPETTWGVFQNLNIAGQPIPVRRGDVLELSGWAIVPGQAQVPRAVGITYGDRRTLLTITPVNIENRAVEEYFNQPAYRMAGWSARISTAWLPEGEITIRAWAYDDKGNQFLGLFTENAPATYVVLAN